MGEQNAVRKARPSLRWGSPPFLLSLHTSNAVGGQRWPGRRAQPQWWQQSAVLSEVRMPDQRPHVHQQLLCCGCRRDTAALTSAKYREMFGEPDDSVPATFQVENPT